jgi:hypothetical protein
MRLKTVVNFCIHLRAGFGLGDAISYKFWADTTTAIRIEDHPTVMEASEKRGPHQKDYHDDIEGEDNYHVVRRFGRHNVWPVKVDVRLLSPQLIANPLIYLL